MSARPNVLDVADQLYRSLPPIPNCLTAREYEARFHEREMAFAQFRHAIANLIDKARDATASGCPCDSCEALRVAVRNCGGAA